ncbi:MraY family glycosyltransferase [Streptomyces californicus]|uniref:MraY family glycosyltransferase n=1 Tax=Streptomyces californicus TaxID=67351 RepID=UPI0033FAD1D6
MNVLGIIASGVAALLITVALARIARRAALRPHTPAASAGRAARAGLLRRTGGTAAVLGVTAAAGGALWLGAADDAPSSAAGLLAGSGTVAALGLVHDLKPLRAVLRLAVQTAAAVLVVCFAGLPPVAAVLTVLWTVLVTNAFALLDHADGLLTVVGVVTAAGLLACAAVDGGSALALLPAALVAGLGGFLLHTWHPARLRLGACGAQFTGFVLAASGALIQAAAPAGRAAWAALPALATVALADTVLVVVSRRRAGRSPLRGGNDHVGHRLRRLRVTVPGTAVLLALWAGVPVAAGTLVHAGLLHPAFLLVPLAGTVAAVLALLRVPGYPPPRPAPPRATASRTHVRRPGASAPAAPAPAVRPAEAPAKGASVGTARTASGRPTVPPPPTGSPSETAAVAADRS